MPFILLHRLHSHEHTSKLPYICIIIDGVGVCCSRFFVISIIIRVVLCSASSGTGDGVEKVAICSRVILLACCRCDLVLDCRDIVGYLLNYIFHARKRTYDAKRGSIQVMMCLRLIAERNIQNYTGEAQEKNGICTHRHSSTHQLMLKL